MKRNELNIAARKVEYSILNGHHLSVHVKNNSDSDLDQSDNRNVILTDEPFQSVHQVNKEMSQATRPMNIIRPIPRDDSFETIILTSKSAIFKNEPVNTNNTIVEANTQQLFPKSPQFSKLKEIFNQITSDINHVEDSPNPSVSIEKKRILCNYENDLVEKLTKFSFADEDKNAECEIVITKSIGTNYLPNNTRVFISNTNNPSEFIVNFLKFI